MSLADLAALIEPAERVIAEIESWRPRFERGQLRPPISRRPVLAAGERFAVDIGRVRTAGLGRAAAGGVLYASDHRVLVFDVGLEPVREWRLEEVQSLSALGNWGGLAIVHAGGDTELVVAAAPAPPTWEDAADWLKVEGALAAARGHLTQWAAELPRRLTVGGDPAPG
jgi:hypothetical protein